MQPYERIRIVRKNELHLSQTAFAEKIGVTRPVIKNIELGAVELKDYMIILICQIFNINKNWLLTGDGDIFNDNTQALMKQISYEYNLNGLQQKIVENFLKLDESKRKIISDYIASLINEDNITDSTDTKQSDKIPTLRLTARGGHYDMKFTDEVEKGVLEDLNYNDSDDDDFL